LAGVGIDKEIAEISIPMYRRVMPDVQGNLSYQNYGKDGQAIYSVSRGGLNCKLMDLAEASGVKIHFEERCTAVNLETGTATFDGPLGAHTVTPDFLVGADGAYSEVRNEMEKRPWFNYSQYYIDYAYKELSIPPNDDGTHRLEKNALHIWPRKDFMLIALPNLDGSFTLTLFFPRKGELSFESLDTIDKAEDFFRETFPDALDLIPQFREEYAANPASAMVIVKCFPWTWGDKVMLIGDAAHAMPPFLGQGSNQAIQDAYCLAKLIFEYNKAQLNGSEDIDFGEVLKTYEKVRWGPTASISAKAFLLGYLEASVGLFAKFRDVFFFTLGSLGVAKKVYLGAAVPEVGDEVN
jgi:kynurenine 3-monooxygenase